MFFIDQQELSVKSLCELRVSSSQVGCPDGRVRLFNGNHRVELQRIDVHKDLENNGRGTILLLCAALWTQQQGIRKLGGVIDESEYDEDRLRGWYERRGMAVEQDGLNFWGDVDKVIGACRNILSTYQIEYQQL